MFNTLNSLSYFAKSMKLAFFSFKSHVPLHFQLLSVLLDWEKTYAKLLGDETWFSQEYSLWSSGLLWIQKIYYHNFNKLVFETIELCHVNFPLSLQGFSRNRRDTITSLINLLLKLLNYVLYQSVMVLICGNKCSGGWVILENGFHA